MTYRRYLLWLTMWFIPYVAAAQEQPEPDAVVDTIYTDLDLFEVIAPMKITLTLNLKEYQRNKMKGEYMPAHFTYQINDTLRLEKEMRVKARGNFRRDYCHFAPFWLNINKADVRNRYLKETKKIKIVTHCGNSEFYQNLVLKEYLAYRIFNILSPVSFRVRLIDMTYVDTGRKGRVTHSWAFMIEPEEMVAERHQALVFKKDDLSMRLMEPEAFDLMALFMYMIGNPDYSVAGRHNVKILGLEGFGSVGYTPVPYDFDYSGLVNASYAIPGDDLGITSVRERYFLGLCRDDGAYLEAINTIHSHREEILDLIRSFPYLEPRERDDMVRYLEGFFRISAIPEALIYELNRTCR